MEFALKKTCSNCPFRCDLTGNFGWLGADRAEEIANSLKQYVFPCHKTVKHDDEGNRVQSVEVACYGALVLTKKEGYLDGHGLIRFARTFGLMRDDYQITDDTKIVNSFKEFVEMHGDFTRNSLIKFNLLKIGKEGKNGLVQEFTKGGGLGLKNNSFKPCEDQIDKISVLRKAYDTGVKTNETVQACRDYMLAIRNKVNLIGGVK